MRSRRRSAHSRRLRSSTSTAQRHSSNARETGWPANWSKRSHDPRSLHHPLKDNKLSERAGAPAHFRQPLRPARRRPGRAMPTTTASSAAPQKGRWRRRLRRRLEARPLRLGKQETQPRLDAALKQLADYALQLDNPPLLVVCDRERIVIHTAFTGYPDRAAQIRIEQPVSRKPASCSTGYYQPEKPRRRSLDRSDHRRSSRPVRPTRRRHAFTRRRG